MIILGIDPGTTSIGYAVLDGDSRNPRLLDSGLLPIHSVPAQDRLVELHTQMDKVIRQWKPVFVSVEKIYFAKNIKTAVSVSEARGVILLTAALAGITLYEYTPLTIKKIVTGDGNADKMQVQKMVRLTLQETESLRSQDDVFDAIASALCCFYQEGRTGYSRSKYI